MIKKGIKTYVLNFRGFPKEIWILATITFINRAGVMVVPFLSKYLKENLHFSYEDVGTIMIFLGIGSLLGSYLGGRLTDKIGFYKIMVFSLFTTGILLFVLQFARTFWEFCIGLFAITTVADMYRPAMFVSIKSYTTPATRVRALTLVRLATNLGFSAGPALGGLVIMTTGYKALFWIDGTTCIIAIMIFALLVKEKKIANSLHGKNGFIKLKNTLVIKDKPFIIFTIVSFITGFIFFQLFTTVPLYCKEVYNLTEFQTGLLLTINGLLIFFLEMPLVSYLERKNVSTTKIIFSAVFLIAISYFTLLISDWAGILILFITVITAGEMMCFSFSNKFAMSRTAKGNEGRYMAFYAMSFSMAHIFSAKTGLELISKFGYATNWHIIGCIGLFGVFLAWILNDMTVKEEKLKQ